MEVKDDTPKSKAKDIVQRIFFQLPNNGGFSGINNVNDRWEEAKKSALICVDEILKVLVFSPTDYGASILYFEQVKDEIEKL